MLNGGGSGKSGSGSDGGHKLVLLKGRYSRQIGIVDDGGRRKISDEGGYVERATGGRRRRGEGGRAGTPKSALSSTENHCDASTATRVVEAAPSSNERWHQVQLS